MTFKKCGCRRPMIGEPPLVCRACGFYLPWVTPGQVKRCRRRHVLRKRGGIYVRALSLPKVYTGDERQRLKRETRQELLWAGAA